MGTDKLDMLKLTSFDGYGYRADMNRMEDRYMSQGWGCGCEVEYFKRNPAAIVTGCDKHRAQIETTLQQLFDRLQEI